MKKKRVNYQNVSKERKTKNTKKSSIIFSVVKRNYVLKEEDWGNDELNSLFDAYEQNQNHQFSYIDI